MNAAAQWEDLVSTALVGTDRRPIAGQAASEVELLERAAVHTLRTRAGRRPVAGTEPPAPAAPEEQPVVPPAAADRFAGLLEGKRPKLLDEWLAAASGHGYRLSPHLLPQLLDHAARDRSIRPHVGVLAGNRGRWLAGLNPSWGFLLEEVTAAAVTGFGGDEVWELGTSGDRRAYLAARRATDPAGARELLAATWEKETPADRETFVKVLADGLSDDDEPFLEAALDDRRREVRNEAAYLLSRLPDSRLGQRMAERVARHLTVKGGRILGNGKILVTPPETCDAAMERDGIRAKAPRGTGEKSWWLQQLVARTPLAVWTRLFGGSPRDIVRMKVVDWRREVAAGWVRAAVVQGDPVWARELFLDDPLADLLAVLPPAERETMAVDFVRHHADRHGRLVDRLVGVPAPWGPDLTLAVLEKIIKLSSGTQSWYVGEVTRLAGERVDPGLHETVRRFSPEPPIQEVAALLRFRDDMLKELQQ
ncbi:DUF5691 domain-containing protein [Streptosporangium sp. NPDC023615]|uniref:DUF5691 domain-containing protein n=1 Tax=Streptosporangium sp. NPDC023615 TaxID=3154794 RepID=UPI003421403D